MAGPGVTYILDNFQTGWIGVDLNSIKSTSMALYVTLRSGAQRSQRKSKSKRQALIKFAQRSPLSACSLSKAL